MNEFLAMTNKEFANNCERVAKGVLSAWCGDVACGSTDGDKQFCLMAHHSWGAGQCDWSNCKNELREALKCVGAVNISGKIRWNVVRLYFNKRKMPIRNKQYKE